MKNGDRALRRLLLLGCAGAAAVIVGSAGSALADNGPHVSTALGVSDVGVNQAVGADGCAACHRAHTAKATFLLKTSQETLCYTCHGSTGTGAATNVKDGVGYTDASRASAPAALRGGGFESALIGSANPTKQTYLATYPDGSSALRNRNQVIPVLAVGTEATSKHSVSGAGVTAWGNGAINAVPPGTAGATVALECGSCHNPHGNGNYRILRPLPVDAGTQVPYVVVPAKPEIVADPNAVPPVEAVPAVPAIMTSANGIAIPDAATKTYTTTNYWLTGDASVPATVSGQAVTAPDGFIANVSDWCSTCHTRYLAGKGSYKTDSGDAMFKYRHRTNIIYKNGAANCITCHVAHGSNANMEGANSSAVAQPDGSVAEQHLGKAGSRLLRVDNRGICVMCHNV